MVTRHLAGTDLTEQRLTAAEITMIVTQIADALDHARDQGLDLSLIHISEPRDS